MSKQTLQEILVEARDKGKNGQVHVVGRQSGKTYGATLVIKGGDIVEARCMQQSGQGALDTLITLDIGYVQFLSNSEQAVAGGGSGQVITEFLSRLSEKPRETSTLTQDVQRILEDLYGSQAAEKIRQIAEAYPPAEKPGEFINQCKVLVEMMLGNDKATELFRSLSDQAGE